MPALSDLVSRFTEFIIDPAILVVFAGGFFYFVWGLVEFLWTLRGGGETSTGKNHMIWGVVGMLVMVSVFGIISVINDTFSLNFGTPDMSRASNINPGINFGGQ
jgi:uncharacterized RDD family membrane protein YckC